MSETPLRRIGRDALDPQWREARDMLNGLTGEPAFIEVMANAPELLKFSMVDFYQNIFFEGRVDARYKQLARLRLSLAHGCRSCNLQNVPGAMSAGVSGAQMAQIEGPDRSLFDAADRAVLEFADEMVLTNTAGRLEAELYGRLREHFDDAQICEMAVVMGFIGGMAKMAFVLDVVEKEDYCPFTPGKPAGRLLEPAG